MFQNTLSGLNLYEVGCMTSRHQVYGGGGGSALAQGPKWWPKKGPTIQIVYHKNLALLKGLFRIPKTLF